MIVRCGFFPPKGFKAINLFGVVIERKGTLMYDWNYHHEIIHTVQMREMLYVFFYLWYGVEFLVRLAQYRKWLTAYKNVSFEREAYDRQKDYGYLDVRRRWAWMRYLGRWSL